jgi:S-(hydroxymethyl)mycothiol dehydrogenase
LTQAVLSCDRAGTCIQLGVIAPGVVIEFPLRRFQDGAGTIRASHYGDTLPSRDFSMLADWYRDGSLKLDELITERIGLADVSQAFARMERGEGLRSVISLPI